MDFYTLILIAISGAILGILSHYANAAKPRTESLISAINDCLPQLQCAECGYPGCRPYAEAIAHNQVLINLCPPGGEQTVSRLAELMNLETIEAPQKPPPTIAYIRADDCVGCTLCYSACPTDAIVGAAQKTHTVITEDCVGCALCLPPCPVDCIEMLPIHEYEN